MGDPVKAVIENGVAILFGLRRRDFEVRRTPEGNVQVSPFTKLTEKDKALIRKNKADILAALAGELAAGAVRSEKKVKALLVERNVLQVLATETDGEYVCVLYAAQRLRVDHPHPRLRLRRLPPGRGDPPGRPGDGDRMTTTITKMLIDHKDAHYPPLNILSILSTFVTKMLKALKDAHKDAHIIIINNIYKSVTYIKMFKMLILGDGI
jgi:hypothetical protein